MTILVIAPVRLPAADRPELMVEAPPRSLGLYVLGSGGPGASGRASSSYLVQLDGTARILVDAGPGSFVRLGESKQSLDHVDQILLTHLHVDHVGELPGLLKARAVSGNDATINIWGPPGSSGGPGAAYFPSVTQFITQQFGARGSFAYLPEFAGRLHLSAHRIEVRQDLPLNPRVDGLRVRAAPGHHGDAPAVFYRIDYGGQSITFSGDVDAAGLPVLRELARGTDLLVFDCVVLDPPQSPAVLYSLHTPPAAIGELAAAAGVRRLLLSHLSPATDHERAQVEASIRRRFSGAVDFADDGEQVTLH